MSFASSRMSGLVDDTSFAQLPSFFRLHDDDDDEPRVVRAFSTVSPSSLAFSEVRERSADSRLAPHSIVISGADESPKEQPGRSEAEESFGAAISDVGTSLAASELSRLEVVGGEWTDGGSST